MPSESVKEEYKYVGKTGCASPQKALLFGDPEYAQPTPYGFAQFRAKRGTRRSGQNRQNHPVKLRFSGTPILAENRRFFDKIKRTRR